MLVSPLRAALQAGNASVARILAGHVSGTLGMAAPSPCAAASSALLGILRPASEHCKQAACGTSTAACGGFTCLWTSQSCGVAGLPARLQVPLGLAATVRRHSTAVAGLDQLLPPFPELVQRMAAVEADCKEVRALAAAVRAQAAAAKADAADVRAGVADVRAQAAAANSPQVEELAAQIALLALGASGFHTTSSTRFQIQHSGSALVQCLSEQGVPNPAQRLGALVPGCAVDVCLSSLSQLRARVQRVQMFITPELRALEPFACHVVEHFEHIYTKCKGEGFKKKKKSWTGRRGLRHKAV